MHSDDRGPVRARVRCAPFPLLRLLTLRCTRRRGAAEGEGAQRTGRGAADDPTWSPADPGDFPVKSSLREMGSRGLSSCGLCRAGLASREPRWISASRPGITGTDFGRAPGAVAHPGREGASLGRIWSGRAFGSSAGHLGRPTSSTHPSSRAPRSVSTSLNPRARLLEVRARGLSDVLAGYPTISRTRSGSGRGAGVGGVGADGDSGPVRALVHLLQGGRAGGPGRVIHRCHRGYGGTGS